MKVKLTLLTPDSNQRLEDYLCCFPIEEQPKKLEEIAEDNFMNLEKFCIYTQGKMIEGQLFVFCDNRNVKDIEGFFAYEIILNQSKKDNEKAPNACTVSGNN